MPLARGTGLGPYEIVSMLGAGGMGEVYRAKDARIGREVAIKVLPAAFSKDPERLRRFEQEVRAVGALNHPNVLTIFDVGAHEGSPYIVSELLEGQTLRARLTDGALPQRKAIDYALQIAQGLAAAHAKNIVHRDLKPENLFLTSDGRVKILDFGLAKLTQPEAPAHGDADAATVAGETDPGTVLGTMGYMAPEQVRGQPADHRIDIFTFGAILCEMLSGKRAFRGDSPIETGNAILKEEPPELPFPGVERVVRHCLEKNPEERFQSAKDLAFALQTLSGSTASAPSQAAPAPTRRRWLKAVAGAAPIAAAAGGFLAGRSSYRTRPPSFHQLTFRRGAIRAARFAPDGNTIIYGAAWEGDPIRLFSTRPENPESRALGLPDADILAISSTGEMAISLHRRFSSVHLSSGTLARVPLASEAPREVLDDVQEADWSPDGSALAVVRRIAGRHRVEFPIGKVLYDTASWLSHPRVSPKGDLVAFLDHPVYPDDLGNVSIVDLAGSKKTLTRTFGSAQGLAWSQSGEEIWFSAAEVGVHSAIWAVTLSGRERLVAPAVGRLILDDISRDGRALITHHTFRSGVMCLPPGEKKERELSWFDWARPRDLSADGKMLLLNEQGQGGGPRYSVYLRKTDGSPAVRLGDGTGEALSPDGRWILSILIKASPAQLILLPTGTGESKSLSLPGLNYRRAGWLPDGKRIFFLGNEPNRGARIYVQPLEGGKPQPISPEGVSEPLLTTPDSQYIGGIDPDRKFTAYPVQGGEPRPVPGITPAESPIRWSGDGRFLYLHRPGEMPARVHRLEITTGRRETWREIMPSDAAGIAVIGPIVMTPDGASYAYRYSRLLSDLNLVDGLR